MNEPKGGRVIAGKFRLEWPIGRGGMGTVWAAMHLQLDMPVAVKFMDPSAADADGRLRFEREARAIAQLRSPHVVQVLDHGVENGVPYIVMELLEGEDLEARLRRVKRLPLPVATRIFTQSAKALRRAHDAGIVHRDLKPNNVFLARVDDEEVVKLLDFGVAKMTWNGALDPHNESTQQGLLLGSPCYMSPEQARGTKSIDHRSDLWSLAVILFRSITGERPFDASTIADLIIKICVEEPPVASQLEPSLPPGIDNFFRRAFAREPEHRYQSALEMAADFEALVRSAGHPGMDMFSGGRVPGAQRSATNPGMQAVPATIQRLATNPGMQAVPATIQRLATNPGLQMPPGLQRVPTNPSMQAVPGQIIQRTSTNPSMSAVNTPLPAPRASMPPPIQPPTQPPTHTSAHPPAHPSAHPSAHPPVQRYDSMQPQRPPAEPAPYAPAPAPAPAPIAAPYAPAARTSFEGALAPRAPHDQGAYGHGDPYADSNARDPYADAQADPYRGGADAPDPSYQGGEYESGAGGEEYDGSQETAHDAYGDASSPSMRLPDSAPHAEGLGNASNTLRQPTASGRQLVVWTTIAAAITAIMVVLIVIMARSRGIGTGSAPAARPSHTPEVSTSVPNAAVPPATASQPSQPPPAATASPGREPGSAGALPSPGAPGAAPVALGVLAPSASASAAVDALPGIPFGVDAEDAGAAPAPQQPPQQGAKSWQPQGKKKPNFGY